MIKKVDLLPDINIGTMSLARIYAQEKAFSGSVLQNDFWVQETDGKITSIISSDGGSMNIYCRNANFEELNVFLQALLPAIIFTEFENAEKLNLVPRRVRNVLVKKTEKTSDLTIAFSLRELYERLNSGSDVDIHLPTFEVFAPDVSHRLRHNAAVAVINDFGGALCFKYKGGAVMSGIALSPEHRGKGLGKKLLNELLSSVDGEFYVSANDENTKFYIRNGFTKVGQAIFGNLR